MNIAFYSDKVKTEYFLIPITSNYTLVMKNMLTVAHLHPVYHLMFVTSGGGYLENGVSKYPLKAKDIFLINPNEKHILSSSHEEGLTYITFNFYLIKPEKMKALNVLEYVDNSNKLKSMESLAETLKLQDIFDINMIDIYFKFDPLLWDNIMNSLASFLALLDKLKFRKIELFKETSIPELWFNYFSKFFLDFYLAVSSCDNMDTQSRKSKELLDRVIHYLNENINEKFTLSKLAAYTNYSAVYLCSYFKQYTGFTINQYFNKLKIMKSCEYLRSTSKSAGEIADLLNFSSAGHFSRSFKSEKKISPSNYRKHTEFF